MCSALFFLILLYVLLWLSSLSLLYPQSFISHVDCLGVVYPSPTFPYCSFRKDMSTIISSFLRSLSLIVYASCCFAFCFPLTLLLSSDVGIVFPCSNSVFPCLYLFQLLSLPSHLSCLLQISSIFPLSVAVVFHLHFLFPRAFIWSCTSLGVSVHSFPICY